MASQGPNNCSAVVNNASVGTLAWSGVTNIIVSNENSAGALISIDDKITNYLWSTGYSFSIPGGATIEGIFVEWLRASGESVSGDSVTDNSVRLIKAGTVVGTDLASGTSWPEDIPVYQTYGGPTSLWGTTWTPAQVNASNFGVALACFLHSAGSGFVGAAVYHVRITVHYIAVVDDQMFIMF